MCDFSVGIDTLFLPGCQKLWIFYLRLFALIKTSSWFDTKIQINKRRTNNAPLLSKLVVNFTLPFEAQDFPIQNPIQFAAFKPF